MKLGMQPACVYTVLFLSLSVVWPGLALMQGMWWAFLPQLLIPAAEASPFSHYGAWILQPSALIIESFWGEDTLKIIESCKLCLPGSYFTGLCSLPLLFLCSIYTLSAILNWYLECSNCHLMLIHTVSCEVTQARNKCNIAVIQINNCRITAEKQKTAFVEICSYLCRLTVCVNKSLQCLQYLPAFSCLAVSASMWLTVLHSYIKKKSSGCFKSYGNLPNLGSFDKYFVNGELMNVFILLLTLVEMFYQRPLAVQQRIKLNIGGCVSSG